MTKVKNINRIDVKIMLRAYHQNIRHFSKCQCVDSCAWMGLEPTAIRRRLRQKSTALNHCATEAALLMQRNTEC